MTHGIDSQQEWNDQTALLVYFLHLALHGYQGRIILPIWEFRQRRLDAVLVQAGVGWVALQKLQVALRVYM